jgi:predicted DNA-binding helix-hairpin-helix protein
MLPTNPVGLLREHRLYQADWLLRFYGFTAEEILNENENLPEGYDPKCHWALKHPEFFPVEINTAPPEVLVRVPGIGFKGAYKIVNARRYSTLDFNDLAKMRIVLKRAINFITCKGKFFGTQNQIAVKNTLLLTSTDNVTLSQLSMFSNDEIKSSVLIGEL